MPHAVLIAVIFAVYFGLMAALFGYLASQVRHCEDEPDEDLAGLDVRDDDDPGPMLMAA